jgi:hypothetical protein
LRDLINKHELSSYFYAGPKGGGKIEAIASDLYQHVDPTGWDERHIAIFWQRVKFNISCIGREAFQNENVKLSEVPGKSSVSDQPIRSHPPVKVWQTTSRKPAPRPLHQRATSHSVTPSIPSDREQVTAIWSAVDDRVQLQIFQKLLQSAKDPKALVHAMFKFCADGYSKNPGEFDFKSHPAPPQQAADIVPPEFAAACRPCELPQVRLPLQSVKDQVSCQTAEAKKKLPDKSSLKKESAIIFPRKGQAEDLLPGATDSHGIPRQRFPQHESPSKLNKTLSKSMDLKTIDGRSIERGEVEKKSREGLASSPEREAAQARAGAYSRIEVLLRNNA